MKEAVIGSRYALAFYEMTKKDNIVEEVYNELSALMEAYEKDNDFKNFLNHPLIEVKTKKDFLAKLFSDKFREESMNIIYYLIDKKRIGLIKVIVTEFLKIYYEKNRIVEAEAIFAVTPSDVQIKTLLEKLKSKEHKEIRLKTKIDKSILGGVIIKIEDRIIDASIKREIDSFRNNFKI